MLPSDDGREGREKSFLDSNTQVASAQEQLCIKFVKIPGFPQSTIYQSRASVEENVHELRNSCAVVNGNVAVRVVKGGFWKQWSLEYIGYTVREVIYCNHRHREACSPIQHFG